ncbi:MAG: GLPGLI family protein, partial [Cruoricaptor ignavus]|nr:GLPGLI family protein [Cruoricaptor ignavus]
MWLFSESSHFVYVVHFKPDSLSDKNERELMVLDINQEKAKFYPLEYLKNDSLFHAKGEYVYTYPKLNIKLERKLGSEENQNFYNQSPLYYLYNTKDKQNWNISNETKQIDRYNVQKATTNFGGRTWEAWFTTEIPISEGPYKFRGLPGLIIAIKDSKSDYDFQLTAVRNHSKSYDTTYFIENLNQLKPLKISEKQFQKLQLDYFDNPSKDYPSNALYVKNKDGEITKVDTKKLNEQMQNYLRKRNNP